VSCFSISDVPPHLKHGATLPCDSLHVSVCRWFSDVNLSQGSVATRMRCGIIFNYRGARNLTKSLAVKEF